MTVGFGEMQKEGQNLISFEEPKMMIDCLKMQFRHKIHAKVEKLHHLAQSKIKRQNGKKQTQNSCEHRRHTHSHTVTRMGRSTGIA